MPCRNKPSGRCIQTHLLTACPKCLTPRSTVCFSAVPAAPGSGYLHGQPSSQLRAPGRGQGGERVAPWEPRANTGSVASALGRGGNKGRWKVSELPVHGAGQSSEAQPETGIVVQVMDGGWALQERGNTGDRCGSGSLMASGICPQGCFQNGPGSLGQLDPESRGPRPRTGAGGF